MTTLEINYNVSEDVRRRELLAAEAGAMERMYSVDWSEVPLPQRETILPLAKVSPSMASITLDARRLWQLRDEPHGSGDRASEWIATGPETNHKMPRTIDAIEDVMEMALPVARNNQDVAGRAAERAAERREQLAEERGRLLNQYEQLHNELYGPDGLITNGDLEGLEAFRFPPGFPEHFRPTQNEYAAMELHGNVRGALRINYGNSVVHDAIQELRRERRRAEKGAWIQAHGSEHLQRAWAAGYNSQRQYVVERAAREAPGWNVDFNDAAAWDSRSFPSVAALAAEDEARELAERLGAALAGVRWLTAPASHEITGDEEDEYGYDDRYFFEAREAVVIRQYLGRYDLVREI